MKTMDLIRWGLAFTEQGTMAVVEGLRASPLVPSTPGAKGGDGNHAIWTVGHLCVIEGALPEILLGEPNPAAHWKPLFGTGTTPSAEASRYPTFDEVLGMFKRVRAGTIKILEAIGEAGLDRAPKKVPPGFEAMMPTCGHAIYLITLHNMVHYGQLADVRRVVGLKPLL